MSAVRKIMLTQAMFTTIDVADFEHLASFRWQAVRSRAGRYYAGRHCDTLGRRRTLLAHRVILDAPAGVEVDHINGNTLDNRRANLRLCTRGENAWNSASWGATSRFKGVCWSKKRGLWQAQITHRYQHRHLGFFASEIVAAEAYDKAARALFGGFARLNFPDQR